MANKLVQSAFQASHLVPLLPITRNLLKSQELSSRTRVSKLADQLFVLVPLRRRRSRDIVAAAENPGDVAFQTETLAQIKSELYDALNGVNRGIFGVSSEKRSEIEDLVKQLESQNPTPDPAMHLDKVCGCWKLAYSTITILGLKRTKLGLRDFVSLGDFLQIIDVDQAKAVNVIKFNVRGLSMLNGQLTIQSSFIIASKSRVDISYENSNITPDQLMNLFRKNYELLLNIFNPEGWLEITYVDESMKIGRDDKGNLFVLDRIKDYEP